ncbi:MAG: SipW-dependent-type signal peptide-containing protein [Clostridia bacterium]|nr:SipW-dependent-type signal peptide-containing protein [Clostridia bacterium]
MATTKTRRKLSTSTIAIIVLSILLLASVAIGVTLAYFTSTADVTGNITLGDPVTITITQGGATASSLTFSGDALPGSVYDQAIGVAAPANTTTALIRAKLTITNTEGATVNVEAATTNNWTEGTDDYYYYNGTLSAGSAVDFVTAVTIPTSLTNTDANKTFTIDVVVEAIQQANNAANTVWTTAPEDWLATYSPLPETGE